MSIKNIFAGLSALNDQRDTYPKKSRALVTVAYGHGQILCWTGTLLEAWFDGSGCSNEYPTMEAAQIPEPGTLATGVYVLENFRIIGGASDIDICYTVRPATPEEWEAHLNGEYPWDPGEPENKVLIGWLIAWATAIRERPRGKP